MRGGYMSYYDCAGCGEKAWSDVPDSPYVVLRDVLMDRNLYYHARCVPGALISPEMVKEEK